MNNVNEKPTIMKSHPKLKNSNATEQNMYVIFRIYTPVTNNPNDVIIDMGC